MPDLWNATYEHLMAEAKRGGIEKPPTPLILNGWVFSTGLEKLLRWQATVDWAKEHSLTDLLPKLDETNSLML
jgi:hypothetical protein